MEKEKAKRDITYCVHPTCRCWRHESNYEFKDDYYSFMACCEKLTNKSNKQTQ